MHLTLFQSGKGDCLLLTNAANTARILIDGGMPKAYREHVAAALGELRTTKKKIDLLYVSHIDRDHIGGVLQMLDDEVAWRVHKHQIASGNASHKPPAVPRPPEVLEIWHNAFHEQLDKNAKPIEEALAAAAPMLSGAELREKREAGLEQAELVTSIQEAIQVSRRIGAKQLGIPLNPAAGGKLMMLREGERPIALGGMTITVLGPTKQHLKKLRDDWNIWLEKSDKTLKAIRETAIKEESRLGTSDLERLLRAVKLQAEAFGNPGEVTPPNLASLTLLVEQAGKSILLTGDARLDQIVIGLEKTGRLTSAAPFVADILKVPHHGSENNIVETTLLDRVTATHYVFCGNGEHENPDVEVVTLVAKKRLQAPGKFKFWFNSSQAASDNQKGGEHMGEVEHEVRRLAKASKGRMKFKFLESGSAVRVM